MDWTRLPVSPWRRLLHLLWQQALWAVPFSLFFGVLFGARRESFEIAFRLSLVFSYAIGLSMWATRFFILPRLPRRPGATSPTALQIGLSYGLTSLVASYTAALVIHLTLVPGFLGNLQGALTTGLYTLLFFGLFSGIRFAMAYHQLALERARAVEQVRAELAQAELRALRAQINPHFLFNTLNTIASLITTQPSAAEETTTRLAELFRYALRASDREHARFAEELAFLRSYLAIEQVRFGDRLRIEESIEPGLEDVLVPTLLLQPLVENAVRHGAGSLPEGGTVRLSARRGSAGLVLEILDDGPGLDASTAPSGNGFGLHSVRERLRATGLPEALTIESSPGAGTRVRITLPLDTAAGVEPQRSPRTREADSC
jgi:two-component sensor histidine kinase